MLELDNYGENYYAYQSIDTAFNRHKQMLYKKDPTNCTYYATKLSINNYLFRKDKYIRVVNEIGKKIQYELPSTVDIHKLKSDYLHVVDPEIVTYSKILTKILHIVNHNQIFFIPNLNSIDTINKHTRYDRIFLFNDEDFVSELKLMYDKETVSNILYKLDIILYRYNNSINNTDYNTIQKNEMTEAYGMTKSDINTFLKNRQSKIKNLELQTNNSIQCQKRLLELKESLYKSNNIRNMPDIISEIQHCWYSTLGLDRLIASDENLVYPKCSSLPFSPEDIYEYSTTENCKSEYTQFMSTNFFADKLGIPNIKNDNTFVLSELFMPEQISLLKIGNYKDAFDKRPLILGNRNLTGSLQLCSQLFRADPFISTNVHSEFISYNRTLNKVVLECATAKDIIFPIIIYGDITTNRYEHFIKEKDDILLGSIVLKADKVRNTKESRYYIAYAYYRGSIDKIILVNFRSNTIIYGTVNEHIRVLYSELNVLVYIKEDLGIELHYYKYDSNPNMLLVSRYKIDAIKEKLLEYKIQESITEYELYKDPEKYIKIRPISTSIISSQQGGSNNINIDDFRAEYTINPIKKIWNIKFANDVSECDDLFPSDLFNEIIEKRNKLYELAKDSVYSLIFDTSYTSYLTDTILPHIPEIRTYEDYNKIITHKRNKKGNIYSLQNKIIKTKSIVPYTFSHNLSVYTYAILESYGLYKSGFKIMLFASNHFILDGIVYYLKYKSIDNLKKTITFSYKTWIYENGIQSKKFPATMSYITTNNISTHYVNKPSDKIITTTTKFDLVIIDIIIRLEQNFYNRSNYNFQIFLHYLYYGLLYLNQNGNIMLYVPVISNMLIYDFISDLASYFSTAHILIYPIKDVTTIFYMIIMKDYSGEYDINKLSEINNKLYENDNTLGYKYYEGKKLISIMTKSENKVMDYKKLLEIVFTENLSRLNDMYSLFANYDLYKENIITNSLIMNMRFVNKYNLELLPWLNNYNYFKFTFDTLVKDSGFVYKSELLTNIDNIILSENDSIDIPCIDYFDDMYYAYENIHKYTDKYDDRSYKNVELYINSIQKELVDILYDKYGVNINGHKVSRAWLKMYEIICETNLIDNTNKNVSGFHICEAPGNFVNSIIYYIKNNTNINEYKWNAQSLASDIADFYDTYGFIKSTKDKWDLADGTGDITKKSNMKHYLERYKPNLIIGDCGEQWSNSSGKNLAVYQLLYAILFPSESAVIKTYYINTDKMYIALLYVFLSVYEKAYMIKSNQNFWSAEIYIIGKGHKGLSDNNRNVLINIFNKLSNGESIYPIKSIPKTFCKYYRDITQYIHNMHYKSRQFFVYVSENNDQFESNKQYMKNVIRDKNMRWIGQYIKKN
jgi:hypothetical protein